MRSSVILTLAVLFVAGTQAAADLVEMLNGQRLEGEVMGTTPKEVLLKMTMGGRSVQMKFRMEKVHAITVGGVRKIVNEKSGSSRPTRPTTAGNTGTKGTGAAGPRPGTEEPGTGKAEPTGEGTEQPGVTGGGKTRTKSEVMALVNRAGKTRPDWWDDVPLNYPQTLNLTWEKPPKGQWNAQKYLGQYIISVVNVNPSKWEGAAKLLHHTLEVNKNDRAKLAMSMERMGHVYCNLLGDHARGAFWWQMAMKYGLRVGWRTWLGLADCYWQLGSKSLAQGILTRLGEDRTGYGSLIKLWSDIGEPRRALVLAERMAASDLADVAYRAAGDVCRAQGKYREALAYYQKVLNVPSQGRRAKGIDQNKTRARESIEAVKVFEALDLTKVPDGTYTGSGIGYRGPIRVQVKVGSGKIESVKVVQHKEDWFYTSFTEVPRQIVEKQSLKGVDAVTGATMTSIGILSGTGKALANAMR